MAKLVLAWFLLVKLRLLYWNWPKLARIDRIDYFLEEISPFDLSSQGTSVVSRASWRHWLRQGHGGEGGCRRRGIVGTYMSGRGRHTCLGGWKRTSSGPVLSPDRSGSSVFWLRPGPEWGPELTKRAVLTPIEGFTVCILTRSVLPMANPYVQILNESGRIRRTLHRGPVH